MKHGGSFDGVYNENWLDKPRRSRYDGDMLTLLLIVLLILAIFGGVALSELLWIVVVLLIVALAFNLLNGRGPRI